MQIDYPCNSSSTFIIKWGDQGYYKAPEKMWWTCKQLRLRRCIPKQMLDPTGDYCLLVMILPKIMYHSGRDFLEEESQPVL